MLFDEIGIKYIEVASRTDEAKTQIRIDSNYLDDGSWKCLNINFINNDFKEFEPWGE